MWEEIYRANRIPLVRYCTGMCHDAAQAEDLVQETFLRALQNTALMEELGPNQRRSWLFTTARNLFCDKVRRATREEERTEFLNPEAVAEETGFCDVDLDQMLCCLPAKDRALVRMRYIEGYNATELGEIFNQPPATIRARLARARGLLRQYMTEG